jgi:hypothetical protein
MTRISISKDCGNSPKNLFLQKMTLAFAKSDQKFLQASLTEDIYWNVLGEKITQGRENLLEKLHWFDDELEELTVQHALTHGKVGAVDGKVKLNTGKNYAFCDVYEFTDTKGTRVKVIVSYRIEMDA